MDTRSKKVQSSFVPSMVCSIAYIVCAAASVVGTPAFAASDSMEPIFETLQYQQKQDYLKAAPSGNDEPPGNAITSVAISDQAVSEVASSLERLAEIRTGELTLNDASQTQALDQELSQFGYEIFNRGDLTQLVDHVLVPSDYEIGPGDTIVVQLYGKRNVEYQLVVTREGKLLIPEFGPLAVAGLSFIEVRNLIVEGFDTRVIGAKSVVTMGDIRSMQVRLTGDVEAPGIYVVNGLATLVDALLASGGIKLSGSLRDIQLMRKGRLFQRLDLYDLLLSGDTQSDVSLRHNDVIFVPPIGDVVTVGGEVQRPAIYELAGRSSLQKVLAMAGGLLPTASMENSYIERIVTNEYRTLVNLSDLKQGQKGQRVENVAILAGDYLRVMPVDNHLDQVVMLSGHLKRPGGYQFHAGMRVSDLIPSPDALLRNADLDFALLKREALGTRRAEVHFLNLYSILRYPRFDTDLLLQPRDEVFLFNLDGNRAASLQGVIRELDIQATAYQAAPTIVFKGNVRFQGRFPLEPGIRLVESMQIAGGIQSGTDMEYGLLFRTLFPSNRVQPIRFNLAKALAMPKSDANPMLLANDRIYLFDTETDRAAMIRQDLLRLTADGHYLDDPEVVSSDGLVRHRGQYPLTASMRASDLLCASDGLEMNADGVEAELSRTHKVFGSEPRIEHIKLDAQYLVQVCGERKAKANQTAAAAMQARRAMSAIPVSGERRITNVIEPVRFELGKANISKSAIRQIQAALAKYTAPDLEVTVVVAGHSDNTPLSAKTAELYRDNQGLSLARAWEVADIIHDHLASNVVIEVKGFGATQPVHSHQTAFARAQNRRVDIHLDVRRILALPELAVSKASAAKGYLLPTALSMDMIGDPFLQSGDQLTFVERSGWREVAKVVLSGEVARPGIYVIDRDETLCSVVERAGGLSSRAWSFGAEFLRVSTRQMQQQTLDGLQDQLDDLMVELSLSHSVNNHEKTPAAGDKDEYLKVLQRLKRAEPNGREVVDLERAMTCDHRYDLALENGDQLYVPQQPRQVSVVGQVYVPTSHAYRDSRSMRDYIELSGGATVIGRLSDAYAIQANGEVLTLKGRGLWLGKRRPQAGATIYVPLNVDRMNTTEHIQAWTRSLIEVALFAGVIL